MTDPIRTDQPLVPVIYDRHRTTEVWECLQPRCGSRFFTGPAPNRKLTMEQVRTIRCDYLTGLATQAELADRYGINPRGIWNIVHNLTYREIEDERSIA